MRIFRSSDNGSGKSEWFDQKSILAKELWRSKYSFFLFGNAQGRMAVSIKSMITNNYIRMPFSFKILALVDVYTDLFVV